MWPCSLRSAQQPWLAQQTPMSAVNFVLGRDALARAGLRGHILPWGGSQHKTHDNTLQRLMQATQADLAADEADAAGTAYTCLD